MESIFCELPKGVFSRRTSQPFPPFPPFSRPVGKNVARSLKASPGQFLPYRGRAAGVLPLGLRVATWGIFGGVAGGL